MIIRDWASYECKLFKNEKDFTADFWRYVKHEWGFWHKLSDMDNWLKPFDAIVVLDHTYFVEFKMGDEKWKTDAYKKLRPNQIAGLRKVAENGGHAFVIYYNRFMQKFYVRQFLPNTKELIIDFKE